MFLYFIFHIHCTFSFMQFIQYMCDTLYDQRYLDPLWSGAVFMVGLGP
uniref:Uncharacterized protein n=1 Tax=Anguilla anguilla TaxID=7936 RepID=A0A0E9PTY8_ANGAN